MNLEALAQLIEKIRIAKIGNPVWLEHKKTFEYQEKTIAVVAFLKLVRAAQGVKTLDILCRNGLFIDMGVVYRCIFDCVAEIHFILQEDAEKNPTVQRFVEAFFSTTIDNLKNNEAKRVESKQIQNSYTRYLTCQPRDHILEQKIRGIYEIFSGYTHAHYAHIMEIYGGREPSFKILGVPSHEKHEMWKEYVAISYEKVLLALNRIVNHYELTQFNNELDVLKRDIGIV